MPKNDITPIVEKIKDKICDQGSGWQVICVVEIYSDDKKEPLLTSVEYSTLLSWLQENKIDYSENKNGSDINHVEKLFMEVRKDHWLVFHCSKIFLMGRFGLQAPEGDVMPMIATIM